MCCGFLFHLFCLVLCLLCIFLLNINTFVPWLLITFNPLCLSLYVYKSFYAFANSFCSFPMTNLRTVIRFPYRLYILIYSISGSIQSDRLTGSHEFTLGACFTPGYGMPDLSTIHTARVSHSTLIRYPGLEKPSWHLD